jgi:two-component system sensor histidine kinase RegB
MKSRSFSKRLGKACRSTFLILDTVEPSSPPPALPLAPRLHPLANPSAVHLLNFRWLTALRWAAVVGQTLTVIFVHTFLDVEMPLVPLGVILSAELLLNLVAWHRGKNQSRLHESELALWVGLDLVSFSAILYFTGGPSNPFNFFYMVHVAMASLTLHARYAWSLVLLSALSFAGLFRWHRPLPTLDNDWDLHLHGLWLSYSLVASCIVYFLQRARSTIEERDAELAVQRKLTEQTERLSSLATLAAGAAHELSSPLATIAVVSKELALDLSEAGNERALEDVELVRGQVERCRKILARLAHTAGEAPGEAEAWLSVDELFSAVTLDLAHGQRVTSHIEPALSRWQLRCPREAFSQALRVLVENAIEAPSDIVELEASLQERDLVLSVTDHGPGMSEATLARVFEPFFTTKPTGKGMGLGLYLARNVILSLRGTLTLRSQPNVGTTATVVLPAERLRLTRSSSLPELARDTLGSLTHR